MIKLMQILDEILSEKDSSTTLQAHTLGLVGRPYGYWADPRTGENVARTINGQLVKLTPKPPEARDSGQNSDANTMKAQTDLAAWRAKQPKPDGQEEMDKWKKYYDTNDDNAVVNILGYDPRIPK